MAYPKPQVKLTLGFTIDTTDEIAQTGLHISTLGGASFDEDAWIAAFSQADADAIGTAYNDMIDDAGGSPYWGDYSSLRTVKASPLDTSGALTGEPTTYALTNTRGGTSRDVPPQCSTVVTLWSGLTFGQANYGRMYLPHTFVAMDAGDAVTNPALCSDLADAAAIFIAAVNTVANGNVAASGVVNMSPVGSGSVKAVSYVRVGDVTDSQRRRRNGLNETYAQATV